MDKLEMTHYRNKKETNAHWHRAAYVQTSGIAIGPEGTARYTARCNGKMKEAPLRNTNLKTKNNKTKKTLTGAEQLMYRRPSSLQILEGRHDTMDKLEKTHYGNCKPKPTVTGAGQYMYRRPSSL